MNLLITVLLILLLVGAIGGLPQTGFVHTNISQACGVLIVVILILIILGRI